MTHRDDQGASSSGPGAFLSPMPAEEFFLKNTDGTAHAEERFHEKVDVKSNDSVIQTGIDNFN